MIDRGGELPLAMSEFGIEWSSGDKTDIFYFVGGDGVYRAGNRDICSIEGKI